MAHKRMFSIIAAIVLTMFSAVGLAAAATAQSTPVRGVYGDMWADVVLGKPDFGEMGPNKVTNGRGFNPGGVIIDRSVIPTACIFMMAATAGCWAARRQPQIRLRFKLDDNNNQIANILNLYGGNDQSQSKRPPLLIVYTTP